MENHSAIGRRTAIVTGGALLGGLSLFALTPENATAAVELETLSVPDASFTDTDGEPAGVYVFVDGRYEWNAGDPPAASCRVILYLRDTGGGFHPVDETTDTVAATSGEGTFALGGNLFDTAVYGPTDFRAPGPDRSTTVHVPLGVLVVVLDDADDVLADARAARVVKVSVTEEGMSAAVGAEGSIVFQADEGDPEPTPP